MTDLTNTDYNAPPSASSAPPPSESTPILDNGVAYQVAASAYGRDVSEQGPSPHDGTDEILALRSQLLAQQRAILEARRAATSEALRAALDHQNELKRAQEEAAKIKSEAEKAKRQAAEVASSLARELQFSEDRPRSAPSHPSGEPSLERELMAKRIASLESEVIAAREKKTVPRWRELKFWLQLFTLLLLLASLVRICISPSIVSPAVTETWRPPETRTPSGSIDLRGKLARRLSAVQDPRANNGSASPNPDFEDAIQRIMITVAAFPDRSFQDLIAEANLDRAPAAPMTCPFSMDNTGSLALIFDKNDHSPNPLVSGLSRCADGLEKLRTARLGKSQ